MTTPLDSLAHLSEQELLHHFEGLVARDRRTTVDLLIAMAEIDERKLWARQACSSMFTFCMKRYRMSEQATAKRLRAARTARRFPLVLAMLERGELHLSAIQRLAGHLTQENHVAVLDRARHRSSREVERLVAEIVPKPDVPSRIRALPRTRHREPPRTRPGVASAPAEGAGPASPDRCPMGPAHAGFDRTGPGQACTEMEDPTIAALQGEGNPTGSCVQGDSGADGGRGVGRLSDSDGDATAHTRHSAWPLRTGSPARPIVALAPRRYKIEITVDEATHDKLRSLQDLLGRSATGSDPAAIVSRAIDVLLTQALTRKAARTDRPRRQADPVATDAAPTNPGRRARGIPAAVRREVWTRDCGRCRYVDARGRRCDETSNVEFHHQAPFARGGRHEPGNIELRCRSHNQYQADLDFGRAFMDGKRGVAARGGTVPGGCCTAEG